LYTAARCVRGGGALRDYAWMGVALGCAILTKYLAVALVPLPLAVAFLDWRTRRAPVAAFRGLSTALGVAFAVALPWLIHNQHLHGSMFYDILRPSVAEVNWSRDRAAIGLAGTSSVGSAALLISGTFRTFWFADWIVKDYVGAPFIMSVAAALALFPLIGILLHLRRAGSTSNDSDGPWAALAVMALASVLLLVSVTIHALAWDPSIVTMGGRYQMAAIAVLGLAYAAAVPGYCRGTRAQYILAVTIALVYLTLAVLSMVATWDFYSSGTYIF
jgi:hypothetical protein